MDQITQFRGDYKFLSNFYPCEVEFRGTFFSSVEAAYQASKSINMDLDPIFSKLSPTQAKKLGKNIMIREDWESIKLEVMETLVRIKFLDPSLRNRLIDTGEAKLYEGNSWGDTFWGVHWDTLEGDNNLGKLLMKLRDEYNSKSIGI